MAASVYSEETRSTTSGGTIPLASQHDRLLIELESAEGQLGAIVRALYIEGEQEEFLQSLAVRVKHHDKDIERMCNKNYQGFIESVTELVKVKSEVHKLMIKVQSANKVIQDSGRELLKQMEELHTARSIQSNVLATIETITLCMPVLDMYRKLQALMKENQFYSALKTLEQLEHTYLPRVQGYMFSDLLAKEIPEMRKSIERKSKSELTEYLAKVREKSEHIGEVAMHQARRNARLELEHDVMEAVDKERSLDQDSSTYELVNFSPVYRCLHIHSVLGKRDKFVEEYRQHRMQQLRLVIKPPKIHDSIKLFKSYLYGIAGYFVVEDTIMNTCQGIGVGHGVEGEGLVSGAVLETFWDMATAEMLSVLRTNCLGCNNYHLLLKIKQLVVWFCHTLNGYGFKVDKLYEVLLEIREHYDEVLMKTWGETFVALLEVDDYHPVSVTTDQHFEGVLDMFPYHDLKIQRQSFPRTFPFSSMVYQIFSQMKAYIKKCASYADRLNLSRTEIDEGVRKSVNLLLTQSMSGCLAHLIQKGNITIQQLTQLWINLDHWENAENDLDEFIASVTQVPRSSITAAQSNRLYGFSTFKDAKLTTQEKLAFKLEVQISEVMDGAVYEWSPKEVMRKPSPFLEDVIRFLTSTFDILSNLPVEVIDCISIHAIQHLVGIMENILLSDKNPRVSIDGLRNFDVDVKRCEDFVRNTASMMVPSLRPASPPSPKVSMSDSIFARLRQLLNMFTESAWTDYINELNTCTAKKFPAVPPEDVYTVLMKVIEFERKKKKKFHHGASKERLKYYDLVIKRLLDFVDHNSNHVGSGPSPD